jgi:hypothetical protein
VIVFFQIVLAIVLFMLTLGFIYAQFSDNVTDDSCVGLGFLWFISVLLFGASFLK